MLQSLLYPIDSASRRTVSLNGMWGFQIDPASCGEQDGWTKKLPKADTLPVPASFADFYTDKAIREYCGDFWYEKDFYVPAEWNGKTVAVRFGSATHVAKVWCNGIEVATHEGGFLPFVADITDCAVYGGVNHIAIRINNELSETRMPVGATKTMPNGRKRATPYFDFYNYSGLHRNVFLMAMPKNRIDDYEVVHSLDGADANVSYKVATIGQGSVEVQLLDAEGNCVARANGSEGILHVENAKLWQVRNAYLYTIVIRLKNGDELIDEYREEIGIRTIEIKGTKILLNGKPVYLKGFGKHEDADIIGRGYSAAVIKRDFELMKWIGANSFRTSHYPYADEVYQMADREGFLVIDEVQAVGCFPSLMNFAEASSGKKVAFFAKETTPQLKEHHKNSIAEMIRRDKNHACVIAWSLLNEPDTSDETATPYFEEVFAYARDCDPQKRPRTFALIGNSSPSVCKCHQVADFLCLNRYYGWYILGGADIEEAEILFRKEMDGWKEVEPNKPIVFSEYGADTHSAIDKLPSVMWSESYQIEVLKMVESVFDSYDNVVGEQVWNFADFQTTEGIMRVDGNKKGIFTRQRQPKRAAFHLKERWESMPNVMDGE